MYFLHFCITSYEPTQFDFLSFEDSKNFIKKFESTSEKEGVEFKQKGVRPAFIFRQPKKVYKGKRFRDW